MSALPDSLQIGLSVIRLDHIPDGLRQKLLLIASCAYETKKQKAALSHDGRPLKG